VIKKNMKKECEDKNCFVCKEPIDFSKDLFVLLGTYEGDRTVNESYSHMNCWRRYFEEKTRDKAMAVINGMQEKMMPIAKQLTDKLKAEIERREGSDGSSPTITI